MILCTNCGRPLGLVQPGFLSQCVCGAVYTIGITSTTTTGTCPYLPDYGSFEPYLPKLSSVPKAFQDAFKDVELEP